MYFKKSKYLIFLIFAIFILQSCNFNDFSDNVTNVTYKNNSFINEEGLVPHGWVRFRGKYNYQTIKHKKKTYKDLEDVFYPLFDNFNYQKDEKDSWDIMPNNDLTGDCEDFALTLKERLKEAGFVVSNTKIALGWEQDDKGKYNKYHAVLIVEVDHGSVYVCSQAGIIMIGQYNIKWHLVHDETETYWIDVSGKDLDNWKFYN